MMKSNLVAGKPALFLCLSACGITSAASTVFFRFRRDFVSGGKSAEKTSIEKSKWDFPKTIPPVGRLAATLWRTGVLPLHTRNWKCSYKIDSRRARKEKRAWKQHLPRRSYVFLRGGNMFLHEVCKNVLECCKNKRNSHFLLRKNFCSII